MSRQKLLVLNMILIDLHELHRTLLRAYSSERIRLPEGAAKLVLRSEGPSVRGGPTAIGFDFAWIQKQGR